MIDGAKELAPAVLHRVEACSIRAPHHIRTVGDDLAIMRRVAMGRSQAPRCQQSMGAHESQDAFAAHVDPAMGQSRPDFPIAFPVKGARGQHPVNGLQERGITPRRLRPAFLRHRRGKTVSSFLAGRLARAELLLA